MPSPDTLHDLDLAEAHRRLANLIRIGTVAEIDHASARARVQSGPMLTALLPWVVERAGNDRTWWAPSIGDQVLVLSPGGDPAGGVILGALYSDQASAPAASGDIQRTMYRDGTTIEYDMAAHRLTIDAMNSGGTIVIRAPSVEINPGGE